MYSLFSNFDNFLTTSEVSQQTYVTASDLFTAKTNRMLGNINKNFRYSRNYSKDYANNYYNQIKLQLKMDELLNPEYILAISKDNTEYMKMYERWRSRSLLDYERQPIYTYRNPSHSVISKEWINLDNFFNEGRTEDPGIPKFFKELLLDFVICVAFFDKFIRRMQQ